MYQSRLSIKARTLKFLLVGLSFLPIAWGRKIAPMLAAIMWKLKLRGARVTEDNLKICLPELTPLQRAELAKQSLSHTAMLLFELSRIWTQPWQQLNKLIEPEVEGKDLLDEALASDRGLVILCPHHGNWELLGPYLQSRKDLSVLYQPGKSPAVDELVLSARQSQGSRMFPTNRKGVMGLFKTLRAGGMTGILPDQVPEDSGGVFAPFFGEPAFTMTLVYNLMQRTGCRLLMGTCERSVQGFRLAFFEPLADIYSDDQHTSLCALNSSIEKLLLRKPEQYQWEYKRFRRVLPGVKRRYEYKLKD